VKVLNIRPKGGKSIGKKGKHTDRLSTTEGKKKEQQMIEVINGHCTDHTDPVENCA